MVKGREEGEELNERPKGWVEVGEMKGGRGVEIVKL